MTVSSEGYLEPQRMSFGSPPMSHRPFSFDETGHPFSPPLYGSAVSSRPRQSSFGFYPLQHWYHGSVGPRRSMSASSHHTCIVIFTFLQVEYALQNFENKSPNRGFLLAATLGIVKKLLAMGFRNACRYRSNETRTPCGRIWIFYIEPLTQVLHTWSAFLKATPFFAFSVQFLKFLKSVIQGLRLCFTFAKRWLFRRILSKYFVFPPIFYIFFFQLADVQ